MQWFWKPWIPRRAVTLIDGDPGLGKSTLSLDLAARASRGFKMPPAAGETDPGRAPCNVLLLGAEDNLAYTVRPRLDAAGADVSRVHALDGIGSGDDERPAVLPYDLGVVEKTIAGLGAQLVIIDPFMAFLGSDVDAHRDQDIRRCMHRLKLLAEATGAAVVLIRHLNKMMGGSSLYRGGGSIGIISAVRSALVVGKNPQDAAQCILAPNKINLVKKPRSLAYAHDPDGEVSRIGWLGETDLTADDILAHPGGKPRQSNAEQCAEAIREILAGGPKESDDLNELLAKRGYSGRAVKAGRRLAAVRAERVGFGKDGAWMVRLPEKETEAETGARGQANGDDAGPEPDRDLP